MDLDHLSGLLFDFTNQNYGKSKLHDFFLLMNRLSLKEMGIGTGDAVDSAGELVAMTHVRDTLRRHYADTPLVLFDVGANIGLFARTALSVFPENRRLYCFEPSSHAFAQLQTALGDRLGRDAFAFKLALGDAEGSLPFFADKPGSTLGSLYRRRLDHFDAEMQLVETVSVSTIDNVCTREGVERIHYLKLDAEGHELKCLEGARSLLDSGRIDFVQFEFGGCNIDSRTFFQDFWYALDRYNIARILRDGLHPITKYTEFEEIFRNQNYLAQRKDLV